MDIPPPLTQTNIVTRIILAILLFTICAALSLIPLISVAADSELAGTLSNAIDNYIRQQMTENKIPGLAISIVQNQETIYLHGFGRASLKKGTVVSPQTVFDLASCSKSFTALAVLLLDYKGLIELDKPFTDYVPEFKLDDNGESTVITVRELLNQTSGLPGTFSEPVAYHQGPDAMENLILAMKKVGINRTPGSSFEYTNLNYALLGALVERISGQTFEDYVKINIFEPLGMKNSTLSPEAAARMDRADGHQLFLGHVVTRNVPIYRSMVPAGWVMSSAEDMSRWLKMNLNDGQLDGVQVMPAEIIRLMHQSEVKITKEGEEAAYGMGWFIDTLDDGTPVFWHGGDTPNFLAEMILLPEQGLGLAMLVNGQTTNTAHQIAQHVMSMVSQKNIKLPAAPWWSSWKSTDDISTYASMISLLSLGALVVYIWWQIKTLGNARNQPLNRGTPSRRRKVWLFVIPATPWAVLLLPVGAAFIIMQTLFGVNVFVTLIRVGYFTPPGVVIAAILILFSLFLWALALSLVTIFKAFNKTRTSG
ncbi:MAG: serine hydrolase [Dehalococcoidales bacterium]|nr:serine hydrolase [Dehalococcoidales bacterium]